MVEGDEGRTGEEGETEKKIRRRGRGRVNRGGRGGGECGKKKEGGERKGKNWKEEYKGQP